MHPPDFETTFAILQRAIDHTRRRRFISGIAISSAEVETRDGLVLNPSGATMWEDVPVPLLLEHDALRPLGFVRSVDERDGALVFEAEIGNADGPVWTQEAWEALLCKSLLRVSIGATKLGPAFGRSYGRFIVREISLTRQPADPGARVQRCWSREPALYLDERASVIEHWRDVSAGKRRAFEWGKP
jgi:hypothetical protein